MKRFAFACLVVAIGAGRAHAQPALAEAPSADTRDAGTATTLSLVGTLAPIALIVEGAHINNSNLVGAGILASFLTPSIGHWYAGHYLTAGLGVRVAGAAVFAAGLVEAVNECFLADSGCDASGADTIMVLGGILYVGGALYDIATAGDAAQEWNSHHLKLAPALINSGGRSNVGLGLGGTF